VGLDTSITRAASVNWSAHWAGERVISETWRQRPIQPFRGFAQRLLNLRAIGRWEGDLLAAWLADGLADGALVELHLRTILDLLQSGGQENAVHFVNGTVPIADQLKNLQFALSPAAASDLKAIKLLLA
jgi:hypothetical protein